MTRARARVVLLRCVLTGLCVNGFALGCSEHLDVLGVDGRDTGNGMGLPDATRAGCDCRSDTLCVIDHCVAVTKIMHVSAGADHSCLVDRGELSCWGNNAAGQLGINDNMQHRTPTLVGKTKDWLDVAAAARHSCGLRAPGALFCWGDNSQGQLGIGNMSQTRSRTPLRVGNLADFTRVSCAGDNCCALRSNNMLSCWGPNDQGNTGTNRNGNSVIAAPTPVASDTKFASVSVGAYHGCAIRTDGALLCWGRNQNGELGLGATRNSTRVPTRVGNDSDWLAVAAGQEHTCGLRNGGVLLCWGGNQYGQVGVGREGPDGVPLINEAPIAVDSSNGWAGVVAGAFHSCARKERNSELFCWGRANNGQVGVGNAPDVVESPSRVAVIGPVTRVALGLQHSCALDAEGELYCWGDNSQGQLGAADAQQRDEPLLIVL